MPSKNKHAVANMCLCLLLLCVTFTLGICLHEPVTACQIVGVTVHYLSLAELFWIIILTLLVCSLGSSLIKLHTGRCRIADID